jgi:organic radical activating enzyme
MTPNTSVLEIWRGHVYERYRAEMSNYILDDNNCRHCIRQCRAGSGEHVFAAEQFDQWADDDRNPPYPKRLIFRLSNTCNLACVMCDGSTSSRIRRDRDKLPPLPSPYGERFFEEMEEILPHVEHVEFYGGEPFLVKAHIRIMDILSRVNPGCTIYVNTNGVSLYPKVKTYLEELNLKTIAVSMDAVSDSLHRQIRFGLRNELFLNNFDYFLDLRSRRGVDIMLNVTEHRKNWYELPEIFRFAEAKEVYLHINTCIHPHNVTLYTLPTDELSYVLRFLVRMRQELLESFPRLSNLSSYDFLLSLIRNELSSRSLNWRPVITNINRECDGLLAAPVPGLAPLQTPEKVVWEMIRISNEIGAPRAARMLDEMLGHVRALSDPEWVSAGLELEHTIQQLRRDEQLQYIEAVVH